MSGELELRFLQQGSQSVADIAAKLAAFLETAQRELELVERGESNADRWQLEQRIKHAENQLGVAGRL